ncbi:glycosyl transferase family 1 [Desulfovibrio sp. ZJ200]|uniref:glycosyl transferase family 1 n=1 Tax=Desulfovibrio sp. ZJ200 TaxID=2709792 RepID=UPI0013EC2787|nr:glycosyl transferase family 1 [Desulfovibrio sp. ZJ200]
MSTPRPELLLAASLDVEEEGLFGGRYSRRRPSVTNTARLAQLEPLCAEGLRPTLFCAHSVLTDPASCATLARLRDRFGAEIGAHLHHWNTPPLTLENPARSDARAGAACAVAAPPDPAKNADVADKAPAAGVPLPLMAAKLARLFKAGRDFQSAPLTSFRMGRWDLHRAHWPLLAQAGVLCDASVRPLHCAARPMQGPDHFGAPFEPYWVPTGGKNIFEVPLTVTPLVRPLPPLLRAMPGKAGSAARAGLKTWGALALLPVYHPLWAMQAVTRLFVARGGRVLSLTWHSSEMMPGGAPHIPDEAAVTRLLTKIRAWMAWLRGRWPVRSLSMQELRLELGPGAACPQSEKPCDWTIDTKKREAQIQENPHDRA